MEQQVIQEQQGTLIAKGTVPLRETGKASLNIIRTDYAWNSNMEIVSIADADKEQDCYIVLTDGRKFKTVPVNSKAYGKHFQLKKSDIPKHTSLTEIKSDTNIEKFNCDAFTHIVRKMLNQNSEEPASKAINKRTHKLERITLPVTTLRISDTRVIQIDPRQVIIQDEQDEQNNGLLELSHADIVIDDNGRKILITVGYNEVTEAYSKRNNLNYAIINPEGYTPRHGRYIEREDESHIKRAIENGLLETDNKADSDIVYWCYNKDIEELTSWKNSITELQVVYPEHMDWILNPKQIRHKISKCPYKSDRTLYKYQCEECERFVCFNEKTDSVTCNQSSVTNRQILSLLAGVLTDKN